MVLMLNGSPRKEGCTYRALTEVAKALKEDGIDSEIINIADRNFTDSDVDAVATKAKEAEGLILGSPVWYASSCGISNYFLDLLFNRISGAMRLIPGASVVSCRRGGASATFDQLNKYFTISQMPVVSSNYWNQVHGNTPEEVEKDEEGLQTMRILGHNMAYMIKAFSLANLEKPEMESRIRTNFIR